MHPTVRPFLGALFYATLHFGGCSFEARPEGTTSLIGPWRWIGSSGGIAGIRPTPDDEEINLIFYFHRNSAVTVYIDDTLRARIPYATVPATPPSVLPRAQELQYAIPIEAFPFDPTIHRHTVKRADADTLILADPCCHRYEHTFVRID